MKDRFLLMIVYFKSAYFFPFKYSIYKVNSEERTVYFRKHWRLHFLYSQLRLPKEKTVSQKWRYAQSPYKVTLPLKETKV